MLLTSCLLFCMKRLCCQLEGFGVWWRKPPVILLQKPKRELVAANTHEEAIQFPCAPFGFGCFMQKFYTGTCNYKPLLF
ncbi:hypothetical protein L3X38_036416 [Prunus dulcis]|uniref:Secreted protein n=1 Tax=Prunus dulcis TaxID=3755 RepID=A0AAD4V1F5_PRUDU|nr:hypothetical protein L3X38_036416 [Prunus dulcis]